MLDWPLVGSVLVQRVMNSIFMIIRHVVTDYPAQVLFAQRDHVIENLAAATSYPPFRYAILPRRCTLVRFGSIPLDCKNLITSGSNFESRSSITQR